MPCYQNSGRVYLTQMEQICNALALLVQPLALPHPSEEPIQVVDFGESGPVRCSQCKAYINPFMKFIDQERRFICNLCGHVNETPRDCHCNLGPDGRRRDVEDRPQLCRGTVEFVATKEFSVRDPMPAVFFFLIDVSMNSIQIGATAAACSAISQVIADLPAKGLGYAMNTAEELKFVKEIAETIGVILDPVYSYSHLKLKILIKIMILEKMVLSWSLLKLTLIRCREVSCSRDIVFYKH